MCGLWQTILLAILSGVVILGHLTNKVLSGRRMSFVMWLLLSAALGALLGLGSALLTLLFMAVKTGLHAHGPEFSALEINWVVQQSPLWIAAGLLGGLGLGLLLRALSTKTD